MIIRAFAAHRPPPDQAVQVACPLSDVLSLDEARTLAANNPSSFLHVSRPEIDLARAPASYGEYRHRKAAANFRALVERGVLVGDRDPHLYVYAQRAGGHRQVGVVACIKVEDYVFGSILPHKPLRDEELDDRIQHIEQLRAHDEAVLLGYRGDPSIDAMVEHATRTPPACQITTADGVEHSVWVADSDISRGLSKRFAEYDARSEAVSKLYILDGHHLGAAATKVHQRLRGRLGGEDDVFLAVLVPHHQVEIASYNRLMRDREARSPEALLVSLRASLDVARATDGMAATPSQPGSFGFYLNGQWYTARVRASGADANDPVDALDCSICQDRIIGPLLGSRTPVDDHLVAFVRGDQGVTELERRVDTGEFTLAIQLFPPAIEQIFAVSDARRAMPKMSFCLPLKPCGGLFVHSF